MCDCVQNKEDWEEACETMTGDRKAVAYLWEDVATELGIVWEASAVGERKGEEPAGSAAVGAGSS